MRKFLTAVGGFQAYIGFNCASLVNFDKSYRSGYRISASVSKELFCFAPAVELNVRRRSALCFWRKP